MCQVYENKPQAFCCASCLLPVVWACSCDMSFLVYQHFDMRCHHQGLFSSGCRIHVSHALCNPSTIVSVRSPRGRSLRWFSTECQSGVYSCTLYSACRQQYVTYTVVPCEENDSSLGVNCSGWTTNKQLHLLFHSFPTRPNYQLTENPNICVVHSAADCVELSCQLNTLI